MVEDLPKGMADKLETRQVNMSRAFEGIGGLVAGNSPRGSGENSGIGEILARKQLAIGAPQNRAVQRVHDDPSAFDENFRDHMLRRTVRIEQEQPPGFQSSAIGQIDEGIG